MEQQYSFFFRLKIDPRATPPPRIDYYVNIIIVLSDWSNDYIFLSFFYPT